MEILAILAAVIAAILTAALFALVSFSVYLVIVHRRYAHIPQPKGASFFMGHLTMISKLGKKEFLFDIVERWYKECGPVFLFWGTYRPIVLALDPECIKVISTLLVSKPKIKRFQKLFGQRFIKNSIATIPHYEDWKDRRRVFDPAFTRSYLRGLVPVYNTVVKTDLIDPLRAKADGKTTVSMINEFTKVTLQLISQVAFGADFQNDPVVKSIAGEEGLIDLLNIAFDGYNAMNRNPLIQFIPFAGRKYANAVRRIRAIGRHCIDLRMKALDNKEELPFDIMSQILSVVHTEKNVDMEDLVDEFLMFYLAGQEPTAALLVFATGLLIQHPDIYQRVMEEIEEVVGDKTTVDADDIDKLTYMNQVFEETLRLFSPGFLQRSAPKGGLDLLGYHIPEGTWIMSMAYPILHNLEYFDNPMKFDPSRFDPGQKKPSPYVYYPFGVGHRSCIARVQVMMQVKVLLVHLLREYNLSLPDDYCLKAAGNTSLFQPVDGLPCTLTLRK